MIAIDVKNRNRYKNTCYSLPYEDELRRAVAFERLFRIPVWYAYFNREDAGQSFHWISALKALEVARSKRRTMAVRNSCRSVWSISSICTAAATSRGCMRIACPASAI